MATSLDCLFVFLSGSGRPAGAVFLGCLFTFSVRFKLVGWLHLTDAVPAINAGARVRTGGSTACSPHVTRPSFTAHDCVRYGYFPQLWTCLPQLTVPRCCRAIPNPSINGSDRWGAGSLARALAPSVAPRHA